MDIASAHQEWYVSSIFSQFSLVWVVLNKTFVGPIERGIDQWWVGVGLVRYLEHSIWTIELEHDLEAFSLSTYLNWFDYDFKADVESHFWYENFPERFLHYLECKVSNNPCSQTKFQL